MSTSLAWDVARAGGLVSYGLLTVTVLWGTAVAARAFRKRPGLPWINGMHEWLGVLTLGFLAMHIVGLLSDTYIRFTLVNVLVPFTSPYRAGAVAWGVIGLYLVAVVHLSARLRRRLPKSVRPLWKRAHLAAYPLFAVATVHLITAGTDARAAYVVWAMSLAVTAVLLAAGLRYARLTGNSQPPPRVPPRWSSTLSS